MSKKIKAMKLESRGLYRRAGAIYSALIGTALTEVERERLRACASRCAELAKCPPPHIETFVEEVRAANSTAHRGAANPGICAELLPRRRPARVREFFIHT